MTARIEWRTKGKGDDALVFIREYGEAGDTVMKSWHADQGLLSDFLNDMETIDTNAVRLETDVNHRDPKQWGTMVIHGHRTVATCWPLTQSPTGTVSTTGSERMVWMRTRGADGSVNSLPSLR